MKAAKTTPNRISIVVVCELQISSCMLGFTVYATLGVHRMTIVV